MQPTLSAYLTHFFPPKPDFTPDHVPNLKGKVYFVSGASSGLGLEVARILYSNDAKVYVTARSPERAKEAVRIIQSAHPTSSGEVISLVLDLIDLSSVKASLKRFLETEEKLHVLFNNAGIMASPNETKKTMQGHELQLGVNCLGSFLLTKLLTPKLEAAAASEPAAAVRVVWLSSFSAEMFCEKDVVFDLNNLDYHVQKPGVYKYGISKAGAWAYGVEFARRYRTAGIASVPLNPGNLRTKLFDSQGFMMRALNAVVLYPMLNGVCTILFAALSPKVTMDRSGSWVIPFGRFYDIRKDMRVATMTASEGGNGGVHKFWEWSEQQVRPYL